MVKSKLSPPRGSAALRQLNPSHKKGAIKFFLSFVNIVFQLSESHQKMNLTANNTLIEEAFNMNVKNSGKIAREN